MATYNPGFGFPPRRGYDSSIPHYGIDFPGIPGSSIPAAAKGVVWYSGWNDSYGNTVIIRHIDASGNAFYSLYAHMNGQDMPALGADVTQGQKIGEVGNTPNVGNHLHFEVIDPAVDDMSDPRFLSENPIYGGGPNGEIGLTGDEFRYDPDSFFDNWSVTDIFNGWITPFLVPNWMWSLLNQDNGERVCFGIDPSFNNYFTRATQWRPSSDPLSLDLDGDGIETVGIKKSHQLSAIS